ncbi:ribonuclease HI family protein [Undibacterium sp. RuRC25W]|uniref:ribonuclease HI family protein n=1 Tax=Undibacterium sp. RuRC25W TaxID=3413047 RepID=UPI003BEFAA1A
MPSHHKQEDSFSDTDWFAWFDGSAKPNPGRCHLACILKGKDGAIYTHTEYIGYGDSSDAEYQALISALKLIAQKTEHPDRVRILLRGDSQVVINDVLGPKNKASQKLSQYRNDALVLISQLPGLTLKWIPRHKNNEVDALMRNDIGIKTEEISL